MLRDEWWEQVSEFDGKIVARRHYLTYLSGRKVKEFKNDTLDDGRIWIWTFLPYRHDMLVARFNRGESVPDFWLEGYMREQHGQNG